MRYQSYTSEVQKFHIIYITYTHIIYTLSLPSDSISSSIFSREVFTFFSHLSQFHQLPEMCHSFVHTLMKLFASYQIHLLGPFLTFECLKGLLIWDIQWLQLARKLTLSHGSVFNFAHAFLLALLYDLNWSSTKRAGFCKSPGCFNHNMSSHTFISSSSIHNHEHNENST